MKRYLLFTGDCYYPNGGWNDNHIWSDDLEELKATSVMDWAHIVDMSLEPPDTICWYSPTKKVWV